jgi:hypothetical protein
VENPFRLDSAWIPAKLLVLGAVQPECRSALPFTAVIAATTIRPPRQNYALHNQRLTPFPRPTPLHAVSRHLSLSEQNGRYPHETSLANRDAARHASFEP